MELIVLNRILGIYTEKSGFLHLIMIRNIVA